MKLKTLQFSDRPVFEKYLNLSCRRLCAYAFENICIWASLFSVQWAIVRGNLCCFFQDKTGCFMYLPPLGRAMDISTVLECFRHMEAINANPDISRIENVTAEERNLFPAPVFRYYKKADEYLLSRKEAGLLSGEKYKHKRNLCNYFEKHFSAVFRPYEPCDQKAVLVLHRAWRAQRHASSEDPVYQFLLEDSGKVFAFLLKSWSRLQMQGFVVEIEGKIQAFSSGFALAGNGPFCINFEFADRSFKGLPAFIFREFSRRLSEPEINIMDDSGLENLRRTKCMYHPSSLVPSYNILLTDDSCL